MKRPSFFPLSLIERAVRSWLSTIKWNVNWVSSNIISIYLAGIEVPLSVNLWNVINVCNVTWHVIFHIYSRFTWDHFCLSTINSSNYLHSQNVCNTQSTLNKVSRWPISFSQGSLRSDAGRRAAGPITISLSVSKIKWMKHVFQLQSDFVRLCIVFYILHRWKCMVFQMLTFHGAFLCITRCWHTRLHGQLTAKWIVSSLARTAWWDMLGQKG